jgi:two-component system sensor histidine kinase HydH
VNTQTLSALVAAIVGFAVGGAVLLRDRRRAVHVLFATFAFNLAIQRLLIFLGSTQDASSLLRWCSMLAAVSLPATAQRFFRAFLGDEAGPPPLSKLTLVGGILLYLALLSSLFLVTPVHTTKWFYGGLLTYVFLGLYLSVYYLYRRYRRTPSRVEKTRLLYLLIGGLATVTAAILDLAPWAPSVGNIFITIYLYFLSQTLVRYRLLDLNELLGRMVVLAALASISTVIYGLLLIKLVDLNEIGLLFLNALIASTAIIIVFEPLRALLERVVNRWMFQEKYELFRRIESLRADLMNVIDVRDLVPRVLSALEDSRRVTHASLYIVDPDGSAYDLVGHVGPRPEGRIDAVAHRGFIDRLRRAGAVSIEGLERELLALRNKQGEEREALLLILRALELVNGSVALAILGEEQLLGMLVLRDERLREAYSTEEIELFRGVAATIGVTLQNSQIYERMKERDRLAALGQMAAGLAHEIRNPLGSIKGAAQYLQPAEGPAQSADASTREFLDIIVEEVDRLNKIVSQFLDYARPYRGDQSPLDLNDVVRKTMNLIEKERSGSRVEIVMNLVDGLPQVRADAQQLRQVFLNLAINAFDAMPQGGRLQVSTSLRRSTRRGASAAFLEIRFRDDGIGIPPADLRNLFIPFFTTKEKGTGLGLPISQRIIENHGGTIEVRSQPGSGSTFTVLLPVEADVYASYAENKKTIPPTARKTPAPPTAMASRKA